METKRGFVDNCGRKRFATSKHKLGLNDGILLAEDYAEIIEEGDYSVPAGNIGEWGKQYGN